MTAPVKQGQEVSGVLLHAFARDSKNLCGTEDKIFEGELAHLADFPDRFRWDELLLLYQRLQALGASLENCGETLLEVPRLETALRIMALAASPTTALSLGARFGVQRLFSHLTSTHELLPDGRFRLTIEIPASYADSHAFFVVTAGAIRAVSRYVGFSEATVELSREDHRGVFRIGLPESNTLWARVQRGLRALRVGDSALRDAAERERLLNERNRELSAALQVKQRFLAVISHELRTPLNGIVGAATVIRDSEDAQERHQFLEELEHSSGRLLRLVSGIVDLSQLEDRHCSAIPEDCQIRIAVEQSLERVERAARAKGIGFRVEIAESVPRVISIDAQRVGSLLDHLCDNAVRFTDRGRCCVRIGADSGSAAPHFLEIAVEDTGIGIAPQDQARVFEMFTQVDDSSERKYQGAGLGLALSRRIAVMMGGSLTLESELGRGSTFRVRLPFAAAKEPAQPEREESSEQIVRDAIAREQGPDSWAVLVVDDSRTNRILLTHFLRKLHWEIDEAENGEEAVAKASARRYRVIFMDCEMPGKDGFQATREIRSRGDHTPIVAVTAYVSDDARKRCIKVGMNQFIGKPVSASQIRSAMRLWTGREEARS